MDPPGLSAGRQGDVAREIGGLRRDRDPGGSPPAKAGGWGGAMEISIRNLSKYYYSEGKTIKALDAVDLTIPANRSEERRVG